MNKKLFDILDNMFTKHLYGMNSNFKLDDYDITLNNVTFMCDIDLVIKERFIITFKIGSNNKRGYVGRIGRLNIDSDGTVELSNNSIRGNAGMGSIYQEEMLIKLYELKREYSLDSLLN